MPPSVTYLHRVRGRLIIVAPYWIIMTSFNQRYPVSKMIDSFNTPICDGGNGDGMAKEDRKRRVLAFLVDSGMAMTRKVLYRNLRYNGADFSDSSLKNYLRELREEGLAERIDAEKFADRNIVRSDEDPGYWIATSEGAEEIKEYRQERNTEFDTGHL
jgi:hypothetical protein